MHYITSIFSVSVLLNFPLKMEAMINEDTGIKEHCLEPYRMWYKECCIFPPFFDKEAAKSCGAMLTVTGTAPTRLITTHLRRNDRGPDYWQCILRRYQLLRSDDPQEDTLDNKKYFKYLDTWVHLNPGYGDVMMNAKSTCRQRYRESFPLHYSLFSGYQSCIRNYINMVCPKVIETTECREFEELYSECKM